MNISDLIRKLDHILYTRGDIDVFLQNGSDGFVCKGQRKVKKVEVNQSLNSTYSKDEVVILS